MTLRCFILAAAAAIPAAAAAQSQPVQMSQPIVSVGLVGLRADGQRSGSASQTGSAVGEDLSGTVQISPCGGLGASSIDNPVSAFASDVWRLGGNVLALSPDQATFQLSWQRLRRGGQDVGGAAKTSTFTLKRGERTTLETVSVPATGACEERTVALEVAFGSRMELLGRSIIMAANADGSAAGGSSPPVSGAGRGGGVVTPGGPDRAATPGARVRFFTGTVGDVKVSRTAAPGAPDPTMSVAELWLVRTSPGRPDETFRASVLVGTLPQTFTFAPLTVHSSSGALTVKVQGTMESGQSAEGEPRLYVSANRTVSFAPANRPARDVAPVVEGSTRTMVPMPGADEVLSFEMPALRTPEGAALPDRLSIRVRITSQPMQEVVR